MNKNTLRILLLLIFAIIGYLQLSFDISNPLINNKSSISQAYSSQKSNVQVQESGKVIKLLKDDLQGSRHQKFIVKLDNGQTILMSHNIDLSPRINNLNVGDTIEFCGEYEYNSKGGVVHWTHKDPRNQHPHGWIKHNGKIYE